jgi:hypothetical protein
MSSSNDTDAQTHKQHVLLSDTQEIAALKPTSMSKSKNYGETCVLLACLLV